MRLLYLMFIFLYFLYISIIYHICIVVRIEKDDIIYGQYPTFHWENIILSVFSYGLHLQLLAISEKVDILYLKTFSIFNQHSSFISNHFILYLENHSFCRRKDQRYKPPNFVFIWYFKSYT